MHGPNWSCQPIDWGLGLGLSRRKVVLFGLEVKATAIAATYDSLRCQSYLSYASNLETLLKSITVRDTTNTARAGANGVPVQRPNIWTQWLFCKTRITSRVPTRIRCAAAGGIRHS